MRERANAARGGRLRVGKGWKRLMGLWGRLCGGRGLVERVRERRGLSQAHGHGRAGGIEGPRSTLLRWTVPPLPSLLVCFLPQETLPRAKLVEAVMAALQQLQLQGVLVSGSGASAASVTAAVLPPPSPAPPASAAASTSTTTATGASSASAHSSTSGTATRGGSVGTVLEGKDRACGRFHRPAAPVIASAPLAARPVV